MTSNTINDAQTIAGGSSAGAMLAGRYRIVRPLGSGGMGSVWLAEDTQLDNKPFAIKMLPSILVSNKRAYRQLKDEALVAMKLTHPNIVTLRAFEENNGNPFLVMDYIDGETLDDYLAKQGGSNLTQSRGEAESQSGGKEGFGYGLPEEEVVRILRPIAAALDYAHGEGVVHRDVKPANVMIRKDGHPFILDFGIAREIQETLTRVTGKLSSGTLLYMSPEQLNGEQPKPAQDVYSFAAMAYECLKGEPPFVRGAIEDQIKNKIPEPLVGASVPLARAVMAGLAKKPEDRPANCSGVLKMSSTAARVHVKPSTAAPSSYPTGKSSTVDAPSSFVKPPETSRIREEHPSNRPQPEWKALMALILCSIAVVMWLGVPARMGVKSNGSWVDVPSKKSEKDRERCVSNLKQISMAIEQCLMAGEMPTAGRLYGPSGLIKIEPTCPLGGHYKIIKNDVGYTVVCPHADEGHRLPSSKTPNNLTTADRVVVPSARLVAKVGSREVYGATFRINGYEYTSPVLLDNLQEGVSIGPFKVTYSENGRRYEKSFKAIAVDWRGAKTYMFPLDEIVGAKHGDVKTLTLPGGATMEMIYVAPGSFLMGSPESEDGRHDSETQHRVTLTRGFWLGRYEVTQEQWESVMGGNPSTFKGNRLPVEKVTWEDCQQFIRKVNAQLNCGARLPTEAEWEYACRAGTTTAYHWGNALNGDKANCNGNLPYGTMVKGRFLVRTTPVGKYGANSWGFYDMHGNVWEWCDDWREYYNDKEAIDPSGPATGALRAVRGGAWCDRAWYCRSACRNWCSPSSYLISFGFRLACSAGPHE